MQGSRVERIAHQLQQEIAVITQREIKDPRLGFVTITRVEPTRDLREAKVYFSCLGDEVSREDSLKGLQSAAGFIHGLLVKRLHIKVVPTLDFRFDPGIERSVHLKEAFDRAEQQPKPSDDA